MCGLFEDLPFHARVMSIPWKGFRSGSNTVCNPAFPPLTAVSLWRYDLIADVDQQKLTSEGQTQLFPRWLSASCLPPLEKESPGKVPDVGSQCRPLPAVID